MKLTRLDIENAEELEKTAEYRERAKKLSMQTALLTSANSLQGELLAVLLKHNATYSQAKAALGGLTAIYEALPYNMRGVE